MSGNGDVPGMDLFAVYLSEREGKRVLRRPEGFAVFGYNCVPGLPFDHAYIQDIFVSTEHRKSGVAAKLADEIHAEAKALGINALIGSIDGNANGAHESLLVLLAYGMKLYTIDNGVAWFIKREK